jgi:small GTP-binding protein
MTKDADQPPGILNMLEGRMQDTWDELPPETRTQLKSVIDKLPGSMGRWRELVDQAAEHLKFAAGRKRLVAILGPANVGKSTLYNQLIRERQDQALVSPVPGTTRENQQADAGLFLIVDTPGADAVGTVGEEERAQALSAAAGADVLIVLFDALHGVRRPERELLAQILDLRKPTIVALNKMDLVETDRDAVVYKARQTAGLEAGEMIPISAKRGDGLVELLRQVVRAEPEIVAALGAALPAYRWSLAQTVIVRAASTAGAIALTPLPIVDFIPLVGVQTAMVLSIARIYAYRITIRRARELLASLGLGVLGRTLFYEISKLGGPPGWLVAAGVAASTTVAMGYAAAIWFERGETLSRQALGRISRTVGETIVERLRNIGRKRPEKKTFQERLRQALDDLPSQQSVNDG